MLTFLGIIVLVIFVHEMGHYLAARAMGVAVDSFSIGFGKVLLGCCSMASWRNCCNGASVQFIVAVAFVLYAPRGSAIS